MVHQNCLFFQNGHTRRITDLSWNSSDVMMIASVSMDNSIHVWKMCEEIYNNEDEDKDNDDDDDGGGGGGGGGGDYDEEIYDYDDDD